jgi:ribosomal protein S18 acetylase RimI-like enzyme
MVRGDFDILPLSDRERISASAGIIRKSFKTVASDLGLTRQNSPTHPSFITNVQLFGLYKRGLMFFGGFLSAKQIGFVAVERVDPLLYYMEKLAVLPPERHHGYGRNLVEFVIEYVRTRGGKKLSIGVIDGQAVLKEWYKNIGFKAVSTRKFAHLPFTVCYMEFDL